MSLANCRRKIKTVGEIFYLLLRKSVCKNVEIFGIGPMSTVVYNLKVYYQYLTAQLLSVFKVNSSWGNISKIFLTPFVVLEFSYHA